MSFATKAKHIDLVRTELSRLSSQKRVGEDYTMICCPYHNDSTPSGRVAHNMKQSVGYFRCYSCSAKASWNQLAETLGLKPFRTEGKPVDEHVDPPDPSFWGQDLFPKTARVKDSGTDNQVFVQEDLKFSRLKSDWRGVKLDLLKWIGAKVAYSPEKDREYVWLPVYAFGDLVGYIKARFEKPEPFINSEGKKISPPSYLNAAGRWSLISGLFPFDSAIELMNEKDLSTMVLVEGPRDALRLLAFGIPAVCILGTHSWTKHKVRMLEKAGVENVILMFDGDEAGRKATLLIYPQIKQFFHTKVVRLWTYEDNPFFSDPDTKDSWDPGNVPKWILRMVKSKLR